MALKRATYTPPPRADAMPRRVGGRGGPSDEALGVSLAGAAVGADLGGSSKYSSEALED